MVIEQITFLCHKVLWPFCILVMLTVYKKHTAPFDIEKWSLLFYNNVVSLGTNLPSLERIALLDAVFHPVLSFNTGKLLYYLHWLFACHTFVDICASDDSLSKIHFIKNADFINNNCKKHGLWHSVKVIMVIKQQRSLCYVTRCCVFLYTVSITSVQKCHSNYNYLCCFVQSKIQYWPRYTNSWCLFKMAATPFWIPRNAAAILNLQKVLLWACLLYTSPSPRD